MTPLLAAPDPALQAARAREQSQLWELLLHSEKAMNARTNFFLIAESMFLVAYSILVAVAPTRGAKVLAVGGLGLSLMWLILQWKTFNDLAKLSAKLQEAEVSKSYLAWKAECSGYLVSHEIIAVVVPALCLIGWFFVLGLGS